MRVPSDIDRYLSDYRRIALKTNFTRGITITLIRFRFFLVIPRRFPPPPPPPTHILSFLFSRTNRVTRIHEFLHTIVLKPRKSNISSLLNSRFVCGGEMNFYEAIPKHGYSFFFHTQTKKRKGANRRDSWKLELIEFIFHMRNDRSLRKV